MSEERTTVTKTPTGESHTTTTIVHDEPRSGPNWVLLVIMLLVVIAGIYLFSQMSGAEVAKDNAVADAADNVGAAAGEVGDAAGQVGDAASDAVNNATGQ
jgi:hypothetical protein